MNDWGALGGWSRRQFVGEPRRSGNPATMGCRYHHLADDVNPNRGLALTRLSLRATFPQNAIRSVCDAVSETMHPRTSNQSAMASSENVIEVDSQKIDLKNRNLAALYAWLVPGAGHFYQGRTTKGSLFLVCIMTTWMLGFALGGGHVVYASWQPGDKRWHYFLQAGVGVAALPALIQGNRMRQMTDQGVTSRAYEPLWWGFMAPPHRPVIEDRTDEVSAWYATYGAGYEMGTWYTMIAGLLNILVIYDAYAGPLAVPISGRRKNGEEPPGKDPPDSSDQSESSQQSESTDQQADAGVAAAGGKS